MNWVDFAVLGVLAVSGILAFMRGFVREVLGIGAWVGAGIVTVWGFAPARRHLAGLLGQLPPWAGDVITLAILFFGSLVILTLIAHWIGSIIRGSGLGGIDRTLGLIFGLGRGAALVLVAYILAARVVPPAQWPGPVQRAAMLGIVYEGASWVTRQLPPGIFDTPLLSPPTLPKLNSETLLRAEPQGRAIGGQPAHE